MDTPVRDSAGLPGGRGEIESEKFNEGMFNTNLRLPKREGQPGAGSESCQPTVARRAGAVRWEMITAGGERREWKGEMGWQ